MADAVLWVLCLGAVVAVLLWRFIPAKRKGGDNAPQMPPKADDEHAHQEDIKTAARTDIALVLDSLYADDPVGDVTELSNNARDKE